MQAGAQVIHGIDNNQSQKKIDFNKTPGNNKKQKISLDISKNVQKNFLSPDIKMNQHNKKIQNSKS
jgi:hypothetical protein